MTVGVRAGAGGSRWAGAARAAVLAASILGASPSGVSPAAAAPGWYVVVATYGLGSPAEMDRQVADAYRAAKPCGLDLFNDFSAKFAGFAPGYNVFVAGPFASKAGARRALAAARPCFPDAFLKQGQYSGE